MIIYDTEVILNEKKNIYISFFLFFYKKDSFFRTISKRNLKPTIFLYIHTINIYILYILYIYILYLYIYILFIYMHIICVVIDVRSVCGSGRSVAGGSVAAA